MVYDINQIVTGGDELHLGHVESFLPGHLQRVQQPAGVVGDYQQRLNSALFECKKGSVGCPFCSCPTVQNAMTGAAFEPKTA